MRAVVQRVLSGSVSVDGEVVGLVASPAGGYVILVGVHRDDTDAEALLLAEKITHLRTFPDEAGRMNRSITEIGGASLVISQFTLHADLRKGRRPSFFDAAPPDHAARLIEVFCAALTGPVEQGRFGAHMHVELVNDGPVTILLDTDDWR
jgi:D-tyrosyl-tRNA(Tyr) deacylase